MKLEFKAGALQEMVPLVFKHGSEMPMLCQCSMGESSINIDNG